ncbi:Nitroreductase [Flavobacterium sp. 9AF]|uniref:nitroreductase family protein n=1 Tax=Flavobacterium sp. 9AF TaxID=2653142 RepID=UPI0012F19126|nr:nitroreductase family protein [Flavobacterium sp. 9AF]VXB50472.1 Nitroreductase [Flavobacterium sp. 9AF]
MKNIIIKIFGLKFIAKVISYKLLIQNFYDDFVLFKKHSIIYKIDNFNKLECQIILDYHSLEKGFLHKDFKLKYGKERVIRLISNLKNKLINEKTTSQIEVAYSVLVDYYEIHLNQKCVIEDYFTIEDYLLFKSKIKQHETGFQEFSAREFYAASTQDFYTFAHSRKSVRNFTGAFVEKELIQKAVTLALTAPSVCNRQGVKVYYVEEKNKINQLLEIQAGFTGFSKNVNQLLFLTVDRNYFYTIGERNQMYIDGGIFLMNLLYALHYYKIGNCPANWGKMTFEDRKANQILRLPESEKIICFIPIGVAQEIFRVTLSKRRNLDEVFVEI